MPMTDVRVEAVVNAMEKPEKPRKGRQNPATEGSIAPEGAEKGPGPPCCLRPLRACVVKDPWCAATGWRTKRGLRPYVQPGG